MLEAKLIVLKCEIPADMHFHLAGALGVCDCDCFWDVLEAFSRLREWEHKEHWSTLLWRSKARCLDVDDFIGSQQSVKTDQERHCDSQLFPEPPARIGNSFLLHARCSR